MELHRCSANSIIASEVGLSQWSVHPRLPSPLFALYCYGAVRTYRSNRARVGIVIGTQVVRGWGSGGGRAGRARGAGGSGRYAGIGRFYLCEGQLRGGLGIL